MRQLHVVLVGPPEEEYIASLGEYDDRVECVYADVDDAFMAGIVEEVIRGEATRAADHCRLCSRGKRSHCRSTFTVEYQAGIERSGRPPPWACAFEPQEPRAVRVAKFTRTT